MGDPGTIAMWAALIGPIFGMGACTFFGLMCFPSIRGAFVERIRQRTLRHSDTTEIVTQIAQLRGEVYALRSELAQANRAFPPANGNIAAAAGSASGRIGPEARQILPGPGIRGSEPQQE